MKKYILSIGLIVPSILFGQLDRSVVPAAGKAPVINIKDSEVFTTVNGITVILSENHKLPKVSFRLVMGATPQAEGAKAGLSGIAGELIMSGTTNRSKDALDSETDYIGANLNANASSIALSCLTKHMEKGLTLMSDVLLNANFPDSEFERVKKQNSSNILSAKSDPQTMASNAESKANFSKGHPYGEIMTEATLNNITLEDVKAFYKSTFTPNGSFLVVVGDINKDQVVKMIDAHFSKWTGVQARKETLIDANFHKGNRVIFVKKPGAVQSVVNVSFPIKIAPGDQDQLPLTVLNGILGGGGFGTRMMANLREDKAYTYGCYSSLNITEDGSYFSTAGNFRNDVTDSAITQILFEIDNIGQSAVKQTELDLTKMTMAGGFARSLESPQTVARFALNIIKNNLKKDYYQTYLKRLEAITKEDVLLMAQKYLTAKNCNIVVVGNEEILAKLKKFDTDGEIEMLDAYGDEIKQIKPANITKEQMIEKYILATTKSTSLKVAKKKLSKIKSIEEVSEMTMAQIPFPLKLTKVWAAPSLEGEKIEGQGMVFQRSYFDGKVGFSNSMQGGKTEMSAEKVAAKNKSIGIIAEMNYLTNGIKCELLGIETMNGKEVFVLKINDGSDEIFNYYDVTSFLKTANTTITKEGGEVREATTTFSDFKDVAEKGILFPQSFTMNDGQNQFNGKIISTIINGKVDFSSFK